VDSTPDLSSANSTQAHWVDGEHQPTDLAVGGSNPSRRAPKPQVNGLGLFALLLGGSERIYADLSADGAPISAGQLAAAAGLSASYARALIAQFQARLPAAVEQNGRRPAPADPEAES
jgi:hypothetical protein